MAPAPGAREFAIPSELAGQRLDKVVIALAPDLTRSAAQRLLKDGLVLLDGAPARASDKPVAGQTLVFCPAIPEPLDLKAEDIPLDVVYEDDDVLVVNKPPEMVVHPAKGHQDGTLVNALLSHCRLSTAGEDIRPGIVHRLDQHTSGLLLIAKHDQSHVALSRQVEAHEARRVYEALVWGHPQPPSGTVRTGFGRHPHHRTMMAVMEEGRGREAVTHYRTMEAYEVVWQPSDCRAGAPTPPAVTADQPDGGVQAPALQSGRPRKRQAALVECVLETG
ncbi:MAG: RluA family pseudouridine synthase, partial [Armatimonadia bacterium]